MFKKPQKTTSEFCVLHYGVHPVRSCYVMLWSVFPSLHSRLSNAYYKLRIRFSGSESL